MEKGASAKELLMFTVTESDFAGLLVAIEGLIGNERPSPGVEKIGSSQRKIFAPNTCSTFFFTPKSYLLV